MARVSALLRQGILALAATLALAAPAIADEAEFFKGKTVRLVVGFAPGGGYDLYARMLAPYLSKQMGATFVVENQPGAGGITALNRIYAATPDGLTWMAVNGTGAAFGQLAEQSGIRFDIAKMGHLGTMNLDPWVWIVATASPIKTARDAFTLGRPVTWGGSGPLDGLSDGALFTCEAIKLNCKVIMGYKGSRDAAGAVMRQEMDALYIGETSAYLYTQGGDTRPIATVARKRSRFYPDTPTIFEAVDVPKENVWLVDFRATAEDLSRIILTSPGIAPARLQYMQEQVKAVLTSKEVIDEGEKTQRYIHFVDAKTTQDAAARVVSALTPAQLETVRKIIGTAVK